MTPHAPNFFCAHTRLNQYLFQLNQLFMYFDPYLGLYPNKIILNMIKHRTMPEDVHYSIRYGIKTLEKATWVAQSV